MKAAFYTLGCKVNQYESQVLAQHFSAAGYEVVAWSAPAQVYVINSCTVTAQGEKKAAQLVRRLRRERPGALVALCGCWPQAFPEKVLEL
ncbi:MAG: tRNA (N(6)-L-threonylcarbamoyladenosine(37)-C(2))-methylthiotransferase MtaB, partial [Oscillospiraceae bacterium]|nr:tRNA (N(6)-L-threonylcarbamoyladenosine(37)-C(2))-methylthiotransferase MtaB [Oscillospiraceae bacterium]